MQEKLVTIITFSYPHETYIYQSKLESEGIQCFLTDLDTIYTDPLVSNALGGIKLKVSESNVESALKIIEEIKKVSQQSAGPQEITLNGHKYLKEIDYCPRRDAPNVNQMMSFARNFR